MATHAVTCSRSFCHRELIEVVLLQRGQKAHLEALIVPDEHAYIYTEGALYCVCVSAERDPSFNKKKLSVPFRTSLISPGGDCKRNWETAWIRSCASIDAIKAEKLRGGKRVSRPGLCRLVLSAREVFSV
jgi:hypothetical protein